MDNLISSVKAATVKNLTRRNLFSDIGPPPTPINTRWGTWLEAVKYYALNFQSIKSIINEMSGEGILVTKCKEAIEHLSLHSDIITILRCYSGFTTVIGQFKGNYIRIKYAIELIEDLDLREAPLNPKTYIQKRLAAN